MTSPARPLRQVYPPDIPPGADEFTARAAAEVARARAWLPTADTTMFDCYLGQIVRQVEPTSEADPIAILASLLAFAGVHLGQGPHVRAGDDPHPLLVWPLVIGHTATGKKGTSWSAARRIIHDTDPTFTTANVKSGLTSGEGLAQRFALDDDGEAPGDLRLLVLESEWGGVMAKMKRDGNSLNAILRQAWEGGDLSTLTVNARIAPESHVGIVAHITPGEFKSKLSDADMAGGTYNRFLPLAVAWSKALPLSQGAAPELVRGIATQLEKRLDDGGRLGVIGFTSTATPVWRNLYLEFNTDTTGHHPHVQQFISRAVPNCLRIAAIHAALDGQHAIHPEHLHAAAALVRYSIASARALFTDTETPARLAAYIAEAGDTGRTRTEINRNHFAGRPPKDLTAMLTQLVDAGRITTGTRPRADGKPGKPSEVYIARAPTRRT
ncbi:DUF3987 domain-containing protein [Amycolatopsis sp. NPDC059021]|uniref:DUF3987 domain-containing protein n=1 Tax=Amycolatopsis sp. NPDC059021 TaxID=3346704 RepID=UPI003671DAC8